MPAPLAPMMATASPGRDVRLTSCSTRSARSRRNVADLEDLMSPRGGAEIRLDTSGWVSTPAGVSSVTFLPKFRTVTRWARSFTTGRWCSMIRMSSRARQLRTAATTSSDFARVHAGGRFVEQEQPRPARHGARHLDQPFLGHRRARPPGAPRGFQPERARSSMRPRAARAPFLLPSGGKGSRSRCSTAMDVADHTFSSTGELVEQPDVLERPLDPHPRTHVAGSSRCARSKGSPGGRGIAPLTRLKSVVLPEPFGPMIACTLFSATPGRQRLTRSGRRSAWSAAERGSSREPGGASRAPVDHALRPEDHQQDEKQAVHEEVPVLEEAEEIRQEREHDGAEHRAQRSRCRRR